MSIKEKIIFLILSLLVNVALFFIFFRSINNDFIYKSKENLIKISFYNEQEEIKKQTDKPYIKEENNLNNKIETNIENQSEDIDYKLDLNKNIKKSNEDKFSSVDISKNDSMQSDSQKDINSEVNKTSNASTEKSSKNNSNIEVKKANKANVVENSFAGVDYTIKNDFSTNFNVVKKMGLTGEFRGILKIKVSSDGEIENVTLTKSSGNKIVDKEAINAAKKMRFSKLRKNGNPVEVLFNKEFAYISK